ncbi:MAG: dockerin type I domain-containing protein [Candidatus Zixiibacteriota bacterium]
MKYKTTKFAGLLLLSMIFAAIMIVGEARAQDIRKQVISSGGENNMTSAGYGLSVTAGQTATGSSYSSDYGLSHGYWVYFGEAGCCDLAGDANNNGVVNILDITFLINYLYKSGPDPACFDKGDANGNGVINILDITRIIGFLYKDGPAPICGISGAK